MDRQNETRIDPTVFWVAVGITALFVAWGVFLPDNLYAVSNAVLNDFLIPNFGWVFILSSIGFVGFSIYLAFSRFGKIKLGTPGEEPEFSTISWVAMMFSAGMGIGLMFYGVAEPMSHMSSPPGGLAKPGSLSAAQTAMEYSYFHWAFHPWAIYAVLGLALAYFTFRKGMPNLISTAFYPLLGDRIYGPIGKAIDILAIFATLFGSATSLGLGAIQMRGGLHFLSDAVPNSGTSGTTVALIIIAVLTVAFVLSAISGVHKGIQWLSNTNMVLAVFLVLFLFVLGGMVFILNTFAESLGGYIAQFVPMSFRTTAFFNDPSFLAGWTIYYWAWWISWAPFVGTFIARISRGRTIREFVIGVILAPSLVSMVWFAIFGGASIKLALAGKINAATIAGTPETSLFAVLNQFPIAAVTSTIAIILVAFFFVSGADAASVVMGMLSSKGVIHPKQWTVITWGVLTGAVAAICLLSGGLTGLQYAAIASGGPFVLVLIALCFSFYKALNADPEMSAEEYITAPEPGRAMSRPSGAPSPQQMSGESPEQGGRSN